MRTLLLCLVIWFAPSLHAQVQNQPLLIGAEDDWAPFSSAENGQPTGMAVDIVRAIFADANIPIKLVSVPYARCMRETKSGRLAGCFDTLPDAQMLRDYLFHTKPLFSDPLLILARADRPVASVQVRDLEDTRVVITHGYSYGDEFESNHKIQRIEGVADISNLRMLVAGRADYAIVYQRILRHQMRNKGHDLSGQLKTVGQLSDAKLYLSFSRNWADMPGVIERFNAAHARLARNGAIAAIHQKWD